MIILIILVSGAVFTAALYTYIAIKNEPLGIENILLITVAFFSWVLALPYLGYCGVYTFLVWPNRDLWLKGRWVCIKTTTANIFNRITHIFGQSTK